MKPLKPILGYTAAGLTVAATVLTPFLLMNVFTRGVAATGLRIDPAYTGGEVVREIARPGYRVRVHREVHPQTPLQRIQPFVQVDWTPAAALPPQIADEVDLDGDGAPDLRARFAVPRDPDAELRVDVEPLTARLKPMRGVGKPSFDTLIARVGDSIVVRVPLTKFTGFRTAPSTLPVRPVPRPPPETYP
ncbi:MAG: hypothetical protein HY822_12090 [Acidobacteria bacterium]|nr:hypothetical protein [Acidobacteriota bacterium]